MGCSNYAHTTLCMNAVLGLHCVISIDILQMFCLLHVLCSVTFRKAVIHLTRKIYVLAVGKPYIAVCIQRSCLLQPFLGMYVDLYQ